MPAENVQDNAELNSKEVKEKEGLDLLREKVASAECAQNVVFEGILRPEIEYNSIISDSNNYFLLKVLSPQIQENEKKKREHKDIMLKVIVRFLEVQFVMLFLLVAGTLGAFFAFHGFQNDIPDETFKIIISFLGIYITSIVVELICIAKYIVVNVFDTSIDGLVKLFSSKDMDVHGDCE